jgi:hypothetical protein
MVWRRNKHKHNDSVYPLVFGVSFSVFSVINLSLSPIGYKYIVQLKVYVQGGCLQFSIRNACMAGRTESLGGSSCYYLIGVVYLLWDATSVSGKQ